MKPLARLLRHADRKIDNLVCGVLFCALCGVGVALLTMHETLERSEREAAALVVTVEVYAETERVLSILKDAEIGQRGYLLTDEPRYLVHYERAAPVIDERIDHLQRLAFENGVAPEHWPRLRELSRRRMELLHRTVGLQKIGLGQEAQRILKTGQGKAIMDEIRALIAQMQREERAWHLRRQEAYEDSIKRARGLLVWLFLVSCPPVAGVLVLMVRQVKAT